MSEQVRVIVGVDGSGRSHRLRQLAAHHDGPVHTIPPTITTDDLARLLDDADDGTLVAVDDVHLLEPAPLRLLTTAAANGVDVVATRRPSLPSPELAALDAALCARGTLEWLGPLDETAVAALLPRVDHTTISAVRTATGGLPALVMAVSPERPASATPALVARVQRTLTLLGPEATRLARLLALGIELPDDARCHALDVDRARLAEAMHRLRDAGLLAEDADHLIPVIAHAVLAELAPAEIRARYADAANALRALGSGAVAVADTLAAADARGAEAATAYVAAADTLRFTAPAMAVRWYEHALNAGADLDSLALGRAEAAAMLGEPIDPDLRADTPHQRHRRALLMGASAAHDGRQDRAAQALLTTDSPGQVLAVASLVATGDIDTARDVAKHDAPPSLRLLADAALALPEPADALPAFIEAAEAAERADPEYVLPDTPHAIGALAAVTAGDAATAEHLLERALHTKTGGPVADTRHRILLSWIQLRTGRYEPAIAESRRLSQLQLGGRERLLLAAVTAGLARRTGDIAQLRAAWHQAEPVLARRAVDLLHIEPLEELLVAAARLKQHDRTTTTLAHLRAILDRCGHPPTWAVTLGWVRCQVAVAAEDAEATATAARDMSGHDAPGRRQRAQQAAARRWADVMAGIVEADTVLTTAADLAVAELPWEASRLAGGAAIRTSEPATTRRLLERARELADLDALTGGETTAARTGTLSEREVDVARMVLAGRTHREIGAQLYVSPKTVEHHVARIRTKLGATSRAELLAALRDELGDDQA
ncbi:LuxR C-terminal-related transcriptional regulator [Haloechinothrix salitolerans]|uniref:LuxR C-terminal-related transcriptional regulator n=1 Tax=Haloechinothrix salitolerans TaxID=926830 RepID=A0ABW2BZR4_9PSEU